MSTPLNLFGEPEKPPYSAALSQWHTPMWIARRIACWIDPGETVVEPACGGGNLIAALIERDHDPEDITAIDIDPQWADYARQRLPGVVVGVHNFLTIPAPVDPYDVALMNPPFEGDLHAQFVERALLWARRVIAVVPVSIEYGEERDRELWAVKARVTSRAKLPCRVKYGGAGSASFDSEVIEITRRRGPRMPGEKNFICEEVWRDGES
jgi:predicted RNA methylase